VAIPPQSADGRSGIVQRNYHYNNHMGIKVIGFKIECDPMEAYGSYYVYFDDLRAVTDLFAKTTGILTTWSISETIKQEQCGVFRERVFRNTPFF
jgi:hypothetical protein